jgi:hypothetical protein
MRALVGLVIGMAMLIVAGVVTIGVTLVHRLGAARPVAMAAGAVTLDEPAGTHILQATEAGGRLTAVLQGGGPDRALVIDLATGHVVARVALTH